jgi:hypothetical protein
MPKEDEQNKERSKITLRIGEVQVELEGTSDNIKKLMDKELVYFAKGLEETAKQVPPSTETAPKAIARTPETPPKTLEAAPKENSMPPTPSSTPSTLQTAPAKKPGFFSRGKKTEKTDKKRNSWKILTEILIIICIVISAGLVGAIAIYSPMVNNLDTQVAEKDFDIAVLNAQIAALHEQIAALQTNLAQNASYIDNLKESIDILNSQIQSYLNIVYMNASEYLPVDDVSQNASTYTVLFEGTLKYTGYVAVSAESTSNTTYIQLLYSSYGVNYDHNVTVATSGTAYFPVLIGEVEIRLGNTDTYTGDFINATVTARYTY